MAAPWHPLLGTFRTRNVDKTRLACGVVQELLESRVFREDIVERLVHHIICGCMDKSGVPVDWAAVTSSRRIDALHMTDLIDFD